MRVFIFLILSFICFAFTAIAQENKPIILPKCALENYSLNFDINLEFTEVKNKKQAVNITIQAENNDIYFTFNQDNYKSNLKLYGRVINVNGTKSGWFTDDILTVIDKSAYSNDKPENLNYSKTFLLDPGVYKIDILLFDRNSKNCGIEMKGFRVPAIDKDVEKKEIAERNKL